MKPFSCLAIDMGAGSIRIVQGIFGNKLTLKEVYRFDNSIEKIDGHERWNLKKITTEIGKGIHMAFADTSVPIHSIGVDSWGVDFVLMDQNGLPVEYPVAYRDERTVGINELWNNTMDEYETFKRTGINFNLFNSLYQFYSIRDSNELKNTQSVLFMADYLNYFLSGKMANEITLASTSQMISISNKNWDADILEMLNVQDKFPLQLIHPGEKLGVLKGFSDNHVEVIAVAGHDTACAVAAIPFENNNSAFIATGTWCIVGMVSNKPLISVKAHEMGITNERTSNGKFRPQKNLMGLWLIQKLRSAFDNKHSYKEIDEMAENAGPSIILIDPNDQIFYNPFNMKRAFDLHLQMKYGTTLNTEAQYYRCAFDSLAHSFNNTLKQLEEISGKSFEVIHLIGGGVKSKLLCQLSAQITNKHVIAGPVESATIGNLIIQARAMGYFNSMDDAHQLIKTSMKVLTYQPTK